MCEGHTDLEILYGVLDAHLEGADYELTMLQPDGSRYGGDAGPHGGGWKGVRGWCEEVARAGGLEAVRALTPETDILLVHVDADIAFEAEHRVGSPCPPPDQTVLAVEAIVVGWLGLPALPARVALWVPAMATEAWLLRAFFPTEARAIPCRGLPPGSDCVECVTDPASVLLGRRPKFVRRRHGALKKIRTAYREQRSAVALAWPGLIGDLWTAERLHQCLSAVIP